MSIALSRPLDFRLRSAVAYFARRDAKIFGIDLLWILFFLAVLLAFHPLPIARVERYFWLLADFAVLLLLVPLRREFFDLVSKNVLVFSWSILACASTIWSLAPVIGLYHGAQLMLTILVGFLLCIYADLRQILKLLFIALMTCVALSGIYTVARPSAAYWGNSWVGVFSHKNLLGSTMALLIITGLCLRLDGWRPWLSTAGVVLGCILLFLSRSGTAIAATLLVLSMLPFVLALRAGRTIASAIFGTVALLLSLAFLGFELLDSDINLYRSALGALGKDETLTGRTILWDFGLQAFYDSPYIGYGYKGYWESTDSSAITLRSMMRQELWYFHNTFLEVAVAFGFVGPALFVATMCHGLYRAFGNFARSNSPLTLWPLLYIYLMVIYSLVEHLLFVNHSAQQFLLVVALAAAPSLGPASAKAPR